MADGESKWAARVVEWRRSGLSAPVFCRDRYFTATALRYWGTRLKRTGVSKEVRLARIVSAGNPMVQDTAIVIEAGGFVPARNELKLLPDVAMPQQRVDEVIKILADLCEGVRTQGLADSAEGE
jgi:hypothetical protein